ncbi:hypothetical protein [Sphingobium sp. Sx8-8]|uniref:hypothetical protein n=1 Tax=Sphingobium sp. Sx8-8 TaxID=2933617 RepID=UPI001F595C95|nr:hypothetical protein [Sphingobium sp. Sx8-8]
MEVEILHEEVEVHGRADRACPAAVMGVVNAETLSGMWQSANWDWTARPRREGGRYTAMASAIFVIRTLTAQFVSQNPRVMMGYAMV